MDGNGTEQPLMDLGNVAQSDVKKWFTDPQNGWAPNAKSTIEGWASPWGKKFKGKGSDAPLIDTGALRQSVSYVIRGG